ncbi:MAG: EAL domain-containing protein [Ruminococcaceae bacterium]|nr:EAL domain-containing protein [Oscillospiraceae bacterium]
MSRRFYVWLQIVLNMVVVAVTLFMIFNVTGVISIPLDNIEVWCVAATVVIVFMRFAVQFTYKHNLEIEQAKIELEAEKNRYSMVSSNNDATIWEYDIAADRLYMMVTKQNGQVGLDEVPDYFDTVIRNTVHPDYYHVIRDFVSELSTSGNISKPYEFMARRTDGDYGWYSLTVAKIISDNNGKPVKALIKTVNIDSELERKEKLRENARLDQLTGLFNRYSLEERVSELIRNTVSRKSHHVMAVIDINKFTLINEVRGNLYGNALLIELAAKLGNILPKNSIIGRFGGDEFVAFVPDCSVDEFTDNYAEKIAHCFKRTISFDDKTEREIKCAVGVAQFPRDGSAYEELFFKSDTALCAAKINDKEYCVYSDGMENNISAVDDQHILYSGSDTGFHSDDLINKIIEILFDARDLSSSISIILSLIGHKYSLDHAYIYEFSEDFTYAEMSYEWNSDRAAPPALSTKHIPMELADRITLCIDKDCFSGNDTAAYCRNDKEAVEFFNSIGAKSLLQCTILDNGACRGHINFCVNDESRTWSQLDINELLLISKIIGGYLVRLRTQQDVDRAAHRDKLTGAWNLSRFLSECSVLLAKNPDKRYCIVYSDIDRFKLINEKYGYAIGNELLIRFSQILSDSLREDESYARANADRFVCILEYEGREVLERRLLAFDQKMNSIKKDEDSCYKVFARSGVYIIPDNNVSDVSSLVDNAIIACNSINIMHRSACAYFEESMKKELSRQQEIEDVMQDALDNGEFVVFYQPKFSLANRDLVGAEALVRWNRPGKGVVVPSEFIPIFEDNGFVVKVDFFVLESVCKKLNQDIREGLPVTPISVNFSRVHLSTPDFIDKIRDCIERYNIPSNLIEIEITESAMTGNEDYLYEIMKSLHRLGIVISMDDFGSGYSSLNLLKKLPFDVLKIDKEFFAGGGGYDRERERTIIANVVNMAKSLDIRVVSEGVETNDQVDFLKEINCDQAQGYYYAKPMDVETFRSRYQRASGDVGV